MKYQRLVALVMSAVSVLDANDANPELCAPVLLASAANKFAPRKRRSDDRLGCLREAGVNKRLFGLHIKASARGSSPP